MAGETLKEPALCLAIHPWSRTSHIVRWLTPTGPVTTLVKGAVRPKSAFLGQYDLNYTCEILYYARAKGELHALRECAPLALRERLRKNFRALVLADYFRQQVGEHAPAGPEARAWYELLEASLDWLAENTEDLVRALIRFELAALSLAGLSPEVEAEAGAFLLRGERQLPVSAAVAAVCRDPTTEKNPQILLDAARAIGVFYVFHMECPPEVRRAVLRMVSNNEERTGKKDG